MRSRIAYKLATIWLAVAVPLIAVLAASYIQQYESRLDLIRQERVGYARLSAFAFASLVGDVQRTMSTLGPPGDDPESRRSALRRMTRAAVEYPADYIAYLDEQGEIVLATDRGVEGRNLADDVAFQVALSARDGGGLEPSEVDETGKPGIHITQRVISEEGAPLGVMMMRIDLARLHSEYPLRVPVGGISIIDAEGQVVFQNEDPRFAARRDRWGDRFPFVRRALEGDVATSRDFEFPGGGQRLGAFVPIRPFGWAAGSSVDEREALESFRQSAFLYLPLALWIAFIGLMISIWISLGVTRSLRHLVRDTQRIGDGEFDRPVRVERTDEIGALSVAMEAARRSLATFETENKRLFEQQRQIAEFNRTLSEISSSLHSSASFNDVLPDVLARSVRVLGCDAAGVNLREGEHWVRQAIHGLPQRFLGERLTDEQNTVANLVQRTRQPVVIGDAASDPRIEDWFAERYGVASVAAFPLVARSEVFGVVFFNYLTTPHEFTDAQIDFMEKLSSSLSLAYENAQLYEAEHEVAERLQGAMLAVPRSIDGIEFAVRYRAASETALVGGDFYDLFSAGEGMLGVTIGDISGHGLDAAVLTSLMRTSMRVRATEPGVSPSEVVATANQVLYEDSGSETFATVIFGMLDISGGGLTYCSGGHTTGVIISASGLRVLPATSSIVGAFPEMEFAEAHAHLAEDELLLLYTDGVIEARTTEGLYGEERLLGLLATLDPLDPEAAVERVFADVVSCTGGNFTDDLAIVALRRLGV